MGNAKYTIQDWAEGFAKRSHLSRAKADSFLRTFFQLIKKGIEEDNFVKVKGLGTFKLVTVGSRESVDVNTGERIEIGEHQRLMFTPDKSLKERVNRPFEQFSTVTIEDDTLDLGALDEVVDEEGQPEGQEPESNSTKETQKADVSGQNTSQNISQPKPETTITVLTPPTSVPTPKPADENDRNSGKLQVQSVSLKPTHRNEAKAPVSEAKETEQISSSNENSASDTENDKHETENSNETSDHEHEVEVKEAELSENKPSNLDNQDVESEAEEAASGNARKIFKYILIFFGLAVLMSGSYLLGYFRVFGGSDVKKISSEENQTTSEQIQKRSEVVSPTSDVAQTAPKTVDSAAVAAQKLAAARRDSLALVKKKEADDLAMSKKYQQLPGGKFLIVGTLETHIMKPGDTLLKLSKKYFGSKDYVQYIVFYNQFENPDVIPLGYKLKIPRLAHRTE